MKIGLILIGLLVCVMFANIAVAESQYGKIDVYYNGKHLPGSEVAKPTLKIGEPFTVKIEMTLNQPSTLAIKLDSSGDNMYEVIEGPSEMKRTKYFKLLDEGTHTFEWTLKPTDEWTGGTMPVNFWYQINMPDEHDSVVNSKFTIVVPYITTEYYESDTTSTDDPTTPQTPAFTLLSAVIVLIVMARKS